MIINIHGFRSNGNNSKYKWLCENVPQHEIYSPTFDYERDNPDNILDHLLNKVRLYTKDSAVNTGNVYVVGSSFGGFFARLVDQLSCATTILINPSLVPFITLRRELHYSYCQRYIRLLARYAYSDDDSEPGGGYKLHVIIGDSDELIDHERITKPLLPTGFNQIHTIKGGTHHLEMTPEISEILRSVIKLPGVQSDEEVTAIHYWGDRKLP
ncbi:hypothetical protein AGMMS50276_04110 [Synergistales bacterium]|nr:hypothetical protein AGMMS50276_04110 [Synergistales bacterium]